MQSFQAGTGFDATLAGNESPAKPGKREQTETPMLSIFSLEGERFSHRKKVLLLTLLTFAALC